MSLFETKRSRIFHKVRIFCPVLILAAVCAVFYLGISSIGNEAITQEQASLRQALEQGAIRTYAMTGAYPQSLDELLTDYGISYDHSKFIVEYEPNGYNLLPSVSVLTLNSSEGGAS